MSDTPSDTQTTAGPTGLLARLPRWVRWLGIALILLVLAGLAMRLLGDDGEARRYATTALQRQDLVVTVSATGNLQPTRQVEVGSETSGLVTQVFVDNNDQVTKGQPLARLDTARLVDSMNQAQGALVSAQAQVASARASLDETNAQLQRLQRVYRASGGKVPSQTELDQGRSSRDQAAALLRANQAAVAQAQAQLSSARTSLAKATIYSPVSGVVLSRKIDPGQTVAASFETPVLFTLAENLERMRLDVKVDEADIGQVEPGQEARFTVDAFPTETFPARVERVDLGANATDDSTSGTSSSSSSSVVSYTARLRVDNPDGRLRPGMTAVATITTQRYDNAFVVPLTALRFRPPPPPRKKMLSIGPPDSGTPTVQQSRIGTGSQQTIHIVKADGSLQPISVQTLAIAGSSAAISGNGLKEDQAVVTGLLEQQP